MVLWVAGRSMMGHTGTPAAPNLIDITVDGREIKAIAQVTKQGFTYMFDRATGVPVWPIIERPVPQSTIPGERASPTQPFPTKPPAFTTQGLTEDDLIDFTPELRAQALKHKVCPPLQAASFTNWYSFVDLDQNSQKSIICVT
jgi:glucose dehydrogenase